MRDPELLISLLREMSNIHTGKIPMIESFGMSESEQHRYHHAEQLVDAGHAVWNDPDKKNLLRITTAGHDFLSAIEEQPKAHNYFVELMNKGLPYVDVALRVVEFVRNI